MKLNFFRFMVLAAVALILGSAASAQSVSLQAQVPFDFVVGDKVYSAGEYVVKTTGDCNCFLLVANRNLKESGMTLSYPLTSGKPAEHAVLIFHHVGDSYFLQEVWTTGSSIGVGFQRSRTETRLALNGTNSEKTTVAANIIH